MLFTKKIKIWQKVLVIAVVFSIPIIITLYTVVKGLSDSIAYSYNELKATEYFTAVYQLMEKMQNQRAILSLIDKGASDKDNLFKNEVAIDDTFEILTSIDNKYGEQLKTTQRLKEMKQKWSSLKSSKSKTNAFEISVAYSNFIEEYLIPFIHVIANISEISLDPLNDGYSIFDSLTRVVTNLTITLDNVRAYTIDLIKNANDKASEKEKKASNLNSQESTKYNFDQLAKGSSEVAFGLKENHSNDDPSVRGKNMLNFFINQVRINLDYLKYNFEWTFSASPTAASAMKESFDHAVSEITNFIEYYDKAVNKGFENFDVSEFSEQATKAINTLYEFIKKEIQTLDSIFYDRISSAKFQRTTILVESGVMIAIAILFCYFVIQEIRVVMNVIQDSSAKLVSSIEGITTSTGQMAKDVIATSHSISEVSISAEEMVQTSKITIEQANSVLDNAEKVDKISEIGRKSTDDTIAGINHIQTQVNSIASNMVRLNNLSQSIGSIVESVEELASQSNLLAFNATLEAVKAGEQGKGFDVVCQEINRLAKQSKQSIEHIRMILDDVKNAIHDAFISTNVGKETVVEGVKQSLAAGQSFSNLSNSLMDSKQNAKQIVIQSKQQFVGIEQLMSAIQQIKQSSGHNAESVKSLEDAIKILNNISTVLNDVMNSYRR